MSVELPHEVYRVTDELPKNGDEAGFAEFLVNECRHAAPLFMEWRVHPAKKWYGVMMVYDRYNSLVMICDCRDCLNQGAMQARETRVRRIIDAANALTSKTGPLKVVEQGPNHRVYERSVTMPIPQQMLDSQ